MDYDLTVTYNQISKRILIIPDGSNIGPATVVLEN